MKHPITIGICVARIHESALEDIHSLCTLIRDNGMRSLIYHFSTDLYKHDDNDRGETALLDLICFSELNALVLFSESIKDDKILELLVARAHAVGVPVINIEHPLENCLQVLFDTRTPFVSVVEHVLGYHHCRRVAMIAGFRGNLMSEERISVYREALERYHIPFDPDLLKYGDFWDGPAAKAVDELMQESVGKPPLEAIICANDAMAMTTCAELAKYGIQVPRDIIVTGFDGTQTGRYFVPRLTTARRDDQTLAEKVVEMLRTVCENPFVSVSNSSLQHEVIISQSCGCEALGNPDATTQLMDLSHELEGMRYFQKQIHEITSHILSPNQTLDDFANNILSSNFGLPWFCCCLVLYRATISGLGYSTEHLQSNINRFEFCQWPSKVSNPLFTPVPPTFLLSDLEDMFEHTSSKALMVSLLHEQSNVFGYYVFGFEPPVSAFSYDTLDYGRLLEYLLSMAHIFNTIIGQKALLEVNGELERLYIHDSMTNLLNRRGFFQRLNWLFAEKQKNGPCWLFIAAIDMDGLKYINDTFGHAEGDYAITTLAKLIVQVAPIGGVVARFGGDEFMVAAVFNEENPAICVDFRNQMSMGIEKLNRTTKKDYCIGASCGIEYTPYHDTTDVDALMRSADDKLYIDKARHKCLRSSKRKP